ncbi:hypothetical protein M6B40_003356 [Vibrio metschnikovii]|uniref:Antitoxin n=1 Tax=bacterium 19MO03SA05 TaxID=2920620 RepID=A0AAU6VNE2_UNCXX|nr:hypothetical protein [Vibrio metschnikovii]EKO3587307.1 hypothetical protein [Vibrio metschnikovii]EKO3601110.1 hypothetical protein [Vibrio metschnikovii]EKO3733446.1 hypothetical protein [Vibrio metschnikovii]EKO3774548.1 hypothetical protein [Vibrio metschnikovii]EKO3781807.1 hypothetical protein [Vibrio metschnikovii]
MKTSTIYAEKAVSSSEARKCFEDCLSGEPVVALSNNEMNADFLKVLERKSAGSTSSFSPMSARLELIAHLNAQALTEFDGSALSEYQE